MRDILNHSESAITTTQTKLDAIENAKLIVQGKMKKEILKTYNKLFGELGKDKEREIGEYDYVNQVGEVIHELLEKHIKLFSRRERYLGEFSSIFNLDEGLIEYVMEEKEILQHTMALNKISFESLNEGRETPYKVSREDIVKYVDFLKKREFKKNDAWIINDATTSLSLQKINDMLNSEDEGATLEVETFYSVEVDPERYYERLAYQKELRGLNW